jgi:tetratricopeptide (TPR) repeat protein
MLEQLAAALDRREYETAEKILTTILHDRPDDPQVQLCAARLYVETDRWDEALQTYQQVLKHGINSKIMGEARGGIQRIQSLKDEAREKILKQARAEAQERPAAGVLILEPIPVEEKQAAAKKFGQIMNLDPYSARLQLPSRGWRLYRSGKIGELEMYQRQLQEVEIPCFCATLADIKSVVVFRVKYMQFFDREVKIFCTDDRLEQWSFRFKWSEVTQVVRGLLPIFEEVVEIDARNRTKRKSRTLDYADMCDIHLAGRRTIFRLCAQTYEFREHQQLAMANSEAMTGDLSNYLNRNANTGILTGDLSGFLNYSHDDNDFFVDDIKSGILTDEFNGTLKTGILNKSMIPFTSHNNWQSLISHLKQLTSHARMSNEFTPFADTALAYPELLSHINSHIELLRRADSQWDQVFQLYSALSMCQYEQLNQSEPDRPESLPTTISSQDLQQSANSGNEFN